MYFFVHAIASEDCDDAHEGEEGELSLGQQSVQRTLPQIIQMSSFEIHQKWVE